MIKLKYLLSISTVALLISGCATTDVNYNKSNNTLTITNSGDSVKISNIRLAKQNGKNYVIKKQGNTEQKLYISKDNPSCSMVNVFKLLPLNMHSYYQTSVYEDLKGKFSKDQITKLGEIYVAKNSRRVTLAFEVDGMHGVSTKTYIDTTPNCYDTLISSTKKGSNWKQ